MQSQTPDPTDAKKRATVAVFTIVANNYLHFARTLLASVMASEPDIDCHCVLVDRDPAPAAELAGEIAFMRIEELGLPGGESFAFQYPVMELCTAVKPWAIARLLESPALRDEMAQAGRARAAQHGWGRAATQFEDIVAAHFPGAARGGQA